MKLRLDVFEVARPSENAPGGSDNNNGCNNSRRAMQVKINEQEVLTGCLLGASHC